MRRRVATIMAVTALTAFSAPQETRAAEEGEAAFYRATVIRPGVYRCDLSLCWITFGSLCCIGEEE